MDVASCSFVFDPPSALSVTEQARPPRGLPGAPMLLGESRFIVRVGCHKVVSHFGVSATINPVARHFYAILLCLGLVARL